MQPSILWNSSVSIFVIEGMAIIHSLKCTMPFSFVVRLLSLSVTHCHLLSLVVSLVVPLVVTRCHSLPFVVTRCTTRCHSLWLIVIHCHPLYHSLSLVATPCHSLSLIVPLVITHCTTRCFTCCYSLLSFVVTRSTTRLSFYKWSTQTVKKHGNTINKLILLRTFKK